MRELFRNKHPSSLTHRTKFIISKAPQGRHTLGDMQRGLTWSGDRLQRKFSICDMPVFAKNVLLSGQAILPVNWCCCHSASMYSCFIQKGQNGLNFQCKIACAPLFQTIPATTRACVSSPKHMFCAYTWRGLSLIHVPVTSPPVCDVEGDTGKRSCHQRISFEISFLAR